MLTHRNMVANVMQAKAAYNATLRPGRELIVTALPLYHIFALTVNALLIFELGGQNILITNPRDIPNFIKELKKYPFTAITGVNTLFNALLNSEDFHEVNFSHLRFAVAGGMAVHQSVAKQWQEITGHTLLEGYGLTEASPLVTVNPHNAKNYTGSIGLPVPSTEARIVDENGQPLPLGESGELQIRGPQVMLGYWQRAEATKKIITEDGWLATGDIARFDENGFLYIVDRKKDMILVSGFNVYPNEIEEVVALHGQVLEVAAIGVPSSSSGEKVKLFIVKRDPSLTEEVIIKHCREHLTGYKVPKSIEFRDILPKSNVGKILRRVLRDEELAKEKAQ